MSGYQIVEPTAGSTDWSDFSTLVNFSMKGFMGVSLTNYDSTDIPAIAAGSRLEVAGSMYYFATTEAITGSLSTNQNYIMVTTSSSSISVSYTTNPPTWVPSKHGWYDSSTGSQRYIGGLSTDSGGKWIYETGQQNKYDTVREQANYGGLKVKIVAMPVWDMDAVAIRNCPHGIGPWANIRSVTGVIRNDSDNGYGVVETSTYGLATISLGSVNVVLSRVAGGDYDSTQYDSTSISRGWLTIWYEE